jgi:spore germination protein GerM
VTVVALAAGGLTLGACGIPTQPSASPISAGAPRTRPPTRPTVSPCTKSGCVTVDVYFVAHTDHLTPVKRVVPRDTKLATVVRSLLYGPTTAEQADGVRTVLGAGIRLLSASVTSKNKVATLNFNTRFFTLFGTQEVLGVAQVVFTVTSVIPGAGVTFEIETGPTEVPVETGALATTIVVHETQYASLRTPTAPTTATTPSTTPSTTTATTTTTTTTIP